MQPRNMKSQNSIFTSCCYEVLRRLPCQRCVGGSCLIFKAPGRISAVVMPVAGSPSTRGYIDVSKVLVIEDDQALTLMLESWLIKDHHVVEIVDNGFDGLERMKYGSLDVIILDWNLPKLSGVEVCRQFREFGGATPVLMLTGKDAVQDKIAGLDAGADDYLTKPFEMEELSARLRALLRRRAPKKVNLLVVRDITFDPVSARVTKQGVEIQLNPKEYALLELFMRNPNQIFTADAILDRLWHIDSEAAVQTVRPYISRLREKLGDKGDNSLIKTVHGLGYKLESDSQ